MANVKELKKKIKSVKGTLKITSAMKLVSAAKLNRAQQNVLGARPYANELERTIKIVSALVQKYQHPFLSEAGEKSGKVALLVISASKGLCGGYNTQLAKAVKHFVEGSKEEVEVYYIGTKVNVILGNLVKVVKTFEYEKLEPTLTEIQKTCNELAALFEESKVEKIYVAYNLFKSVISFIPTIKQALPMTLSTADAEEAKKNFPFDFKYTPNSKEILDTLIPEAYYNNIFTCVLDAIAAEHGSRMAAMDNASNNCKEAIRTLTLKMNKLRQSAITTELIEVVSGAESLKG
ncbi:MAG: ATP synthase F1 subunit gamma [Bdellovibrionales bacterium RIFOXYD12_FULL_39_22]|nr:MAG: ATP synthase F1 subunit gamma [Bdellovibrionales bacterium RIFOXYB1_FULL_39_21]OFZ45190.1 MAG: ATP synthase F1 subunit gamma [Bdellovibrionales bacterium RIFOXYC12_FULL_39_17]OFZ45618.1 MAG: ATP synthase F1 subunit gamma [Bdellovibrionales bacterium RIFOXYC1_FULL_39_130]OFZ74072.1 MAG: ATP synthase F1 subunit gamma [Bdellovibrionales bacterium RIFOXYC2_FULL_39_8]OFZ77480.1 MAG: ATP synthase F1 subunit gamma [Bdellovibrionales bacterium RIFOXYD1_FULL_39_84]OFZ91609.1 MAG: ATP synthase F